MSKKGIGKIFEEEIKASFPSGYYVERYKDDTAGFYGVSNPADYRLYRYPYVFLLELKTHKGKSIPFDKIRDSQITGMRKAIEHKGIYGGFIFNFRDLEETYYIALSDVIFYKANSVDDALKYIINYKPSEDKDKWLEKFSFTK